MRSFAEKSDGVMSRIANGILKGLQACRGQSELTRSRVARDVGGIASRLGAFA
jgi:hypothetical protein